MLCLPRLMTEHCGGKDNSMAKDKSAAVELEKDSKESKKDKAAKKKQGGISKWFKDLKLELSKVVWPSGKTVANNSIVVFAAMLGCALLTFLLDQGFLWLLEVAISKNS